MRRQTWGNYFLDTIEEVESEKDSSGWNTCGVLWKLAQIIQIDESCDPVYKIASTYREGALVQ